MQHMHPGRALVGRIGIEQRAPMRVVADAMADEQVRHGRGPGKDHLFYASRPVQS